MLRMKQAAPCYPVTLAEARKHLAVDASDRSNDALIEMLIASATNDAELKTGRIWVESKWEWELDKVEINTPIKFPVAPVVDVQVYDLDETIDEGGSRTDLSGKVCKIVYPSPEPQGSPLIGSLLPLSGFPANYQILLTVGYPFQTLTEPVEQFTAPTLEYVKTGYSSSKIHLVFDRPVRGTAEPTNFSILQNEAEVAVEAVSFVNGAVNLSVIGLTEGSSVVVSFAEGAIYDEFSNFVAPIFNQELPNVIFVTEAQFQQPSIVPVETVYTSNAPAPVKTWILTRVGSLYSQRTEIALRAGKSNDAMFPDTFINNLLNPYKVSFA